VFIVEVSTGQQRQVKELPSSGDSGQPAWLPDSRHLVVPYQILSGIAYTDLGILDVNDGSMSRLTTTVSEGFLTPSVSADGSRLVATSLRRIWEVWKVPLGRDPDSNGKAAIRMIDSSKTPVFGFVSRDGRTLLYRSRASGTGNLWMTPVDGLTPARQITNMPGDVIGHHSLSPDGTHVTFVSTASGQSDIWIQHVDGSDLRQLTDDEAADSWPIWSPDGQWVVYQTFRGTRREEWRVRPSGGTPEKFLDEGIRGDWIKRPDGEGTWIATASSSVHLIDVERRALVWASPLDGTGFAMPMFSRDGRSISAVFTEGRDHTVVRIFDAATGQSRDAVKLPFLGVFRANWVDDDRALLVNRQDLVRHTVMLDHFWAGRREP
jgi:Tol biopolymer transport system component